MKKKTENKFFNNRKMLFNNLSGFSPEEKR